MAKVKQYHSTLLASIHETAEGLNSTGVMDKQALSEFDELKLLSLVAQKGLATVA